MTKLPKGFTPLHPAKGGSHGSMFIRIRSFTATNGSRAYNASISSALFAGLDSPTHVEIAVNAAGRVLIQRGESFKVTPTNKGKMGHVAAGALVRAGLSPETRIYFTQHEDGYFISEARA